MKKHTKTKSSITVQHRFCTLLIPFFVSLTAALPLLFGLKLLAQAPPPAAGGPAQPPLVGPVVEPKEEKNPYTGIPQAVEEGKKLYFRASCNACHGGGGGGGMCPPIINDVWVYGSKDKILFMLIKYGSLGLQSKGYTRIGRENVVAPMPPFGSVLQDDEIWRVLAYVRSLYKGIQRRSIGETRFSLKNVSHHFWMSAFAKALLGITMKA
jgi:mono/diheme cytochrome c family protein